MVLSIDRSIDDDATAGSDDHVTITVQGDPVCSYDDHAGVVLGEGGVRRYDTGFNVLRVYGGRVTADRSMRDYLIAPTDCVTV